MVKSKMNLEQSNRDGTIYAGEVISGSECKNGEDLDYRISNENITNAIFAGSCRTGKTEAAIGFVSELANNIIRKPHNKRMRVVILDPKEDWRKLAGLVEHERFRFYSLKNTEFCPFKLNPFKVPYGVDAEFHINSFVEIFSNSYELGSISRMVLKEATKELAAQVGVFDTVDPKEVTERSSTITLADVFHKLNSDKQAQKFGKDKSEAVDKLLDKLQVYAWDKGIMYKLYSQKDGMSVDEFLGEDSVIVLEGGNLYSYDMSFIFGFITASIYMYAKHCRNNFYNENQYETLLVVEDAEKVFLDNRLERQSIFDDMISQAAGLGLFVTSITQRPTLMPSSVLANSGLLWVGRMCITEDISTMMDMLGEGYEAKKKIPFYPLGQFMCKQVQNLENKDLSKTIVKSKKIDIQKPSNEELKKIMSLK